jgi:VCBS repeat protein/ASPIC/UnbV protein
MNAHSGALGGGRTVAIRGTAYPLLLPKLSDPRLHLAAVIVSLQVLGQVAFGFNLSIAQILVSLGTCAVLETTIGFWQQRMIMWPASALLTGNGVAFILRVPGTRHGDWWSLQGWWIFVVTAAVSLLSKYVIRLRGRHLFNPSNIGLVACFLILGSGRAEPLDFWWGPMTPALALALVIILVGGLAILTRLHLLVIAVGFWLAFAAGIALLAATGHAMTARWHVGPITGPYFWWVLVSSPEILVFLFFMITDPKTTPNTTRARSLYAVSVGLLAPLLMAPAKTEFWSKVAVLGALAIVTGVRPLLAYVRFQRIGGRKLAVAGAAVLVAYTGAVVAAGIRARPDTTPLPLAQTGRLPQIAILPSKRVQTVLDRNLARRIAGDLIAGLQLQTTALAERRGKQLAGAATGDELIALGRQVRAAAGGTIVVPAYRVDQMRVHLEAGHGQGAAIAVATLAGSLQLTAYKDVPPNVVRRDPAGPLRETLELELDGGHWLVAHVRSGRPVPVPAPPTISAATLRAAATGFAGVRLSDVAHRVGLDFRQGAFRFGVTPDPAAMMGGGVCWLDYDHDGNMDLFVVNSYSDGDIGAWNARGGLPTTQLFDNEGGRFVNVTRASGAGLQVKGEGCVAGDLNGDGYPDIFVTTASSDKLLWNNGNGTFTEGARSSGVVSFGWHSGAAIGDVNGDGRPDLFVAGYTEANGAIPGSSAGYPTNHLGVRDLLFLNEGNGPDGRARFREVGRQAGLDRPPYDHSLGAVFTDLNGDGRLDLYVANDGDPNRYYDNLPAPGLGFRFVDRTQSMGLASRQAGMGIAEADYNNDGRQDLFISNSRGQTHAVFRSRGTTFVDGRSAFESAFGMNFTGWGVSWVDLNNDGRPDLVLANGAIPVTNLAKDAGPVQVLENLPGGFVNATSLVGIGTLPRVNGRGVAVADANNDGHMDVAINSVGGRLILLRGTSGTGHWLEVKLPRFAPGAMVTAVLPDGRRLVQEVQAGSSYLSSGDPRPHFGIGSATRVRELIVRYPSGLVTRMANVAVDRIVAAP